MRHFILRYTLSPDYLSRRATYRVPHLRLAHAAAERGELLLGGAVGDPVESAMLLFAGDSDAAARAFAAADPYVLNGLVTRWDVQPWATVAGPHAAAPVDPDRL